MKNKLSHSASSLYSDCGYKFFLHYRKKLRPTSQRSALFFGSAIDKALIVLLKSKDLELSKAEFQRAWTTGVINNQLIHLPTSEKVLYSNTDFDVDFLQQPDFLFLEKKFKIEDARFIIEEVFSVKKTSGLKKLGELERAIYNYACWASLYRKGLLILDAVNKEVLPLITKVYSLQEPITLENDEGDQVTGFADLIGEIKGYSGPIVTDFKTSSKEYDKDSVKVSEQLALYAYALYDKYKTFQAAYIVIDKNLKKIKEKECLECGKNGTGHQHRTCDNIVDDKRCDGEWEVTPRFEVPIQIIVDKIPEEFVDKVIAGLNDRNYSIRSGKFEKNFNSCFKFGKCAYYDYCHKGSEEGLVNLSKKEDK